jgi:hypothetical protein
LSPIAFDLSLNYGLSANSLSVAAQTLCLASFLRQYKEKISEKQKEVPDLGLRHRTLLSTT